MPPSSVLNPQSPDARMISNLFVLTLVIGGMIFAIVAAGAIFAIVRYRSRPGMPEPRQVFGNTALELTWTLIPVAILIVLYVLTVGTMKRLTAGDPGQAQQPDVVVIGHQWWWEYRYPKAGIVTANEVHIPTGRRLRIQVLSADVIHDFWVPELAPKIDAIPGKTDQYIYLQADKPGLYLGTCAEYCGTQHAWMRIRVYAQTPADFSAWEQQQERVPPTPTTGPAAQGAQLFQQKSCAVCHTIAGTAAHGVAGPDLTHVGTRDTLATGIITADKAGLAAWISDPQAIKPGNHMPSLDLSSQEVAALVAYLEALK